MTRQRWGVVAIALGTIMFGAAIAYRDVVSPWLTNLAAAMVAIALASFALRGQARKLLAFRPRSTAVAVGLGLLMVAATHASFRVAVGLLPGLEDRVADLYSDIRTTTLGVAITIPLIMAVVFSEELLWRGVAIELCRRRLSRPSAALVAVGLYAAPQLIGGSWILVAAAVVVGGVLTAQRLITKRLTEPIITHAIWSLSIFSLAPLG